MTRTATTSRAHSILRLSIIASVGLVVGLTAGCKQQVLCPALEGCGGPIPSGDYVLDPAHVSCSEDLWVPPPDPRLRQADLPVARTPPPEPAHFDWCELIGTGQGASIIRNPPPNIFVDSAPIGAADLHYDAATMSYSLSTRRQGTFVLDMPSFCMRAFGAMPSADGMNICQRLETALPLNVQAKFTNFHCGPDPNDPPDNYGCLCTYDLLDVQTSTGRFIPGDDGTILHLPGNEFPESVSYCNSGERLQLTGGGGEYLFDRLGLRTMDMKKITINCTDGVRGPGEDGVDCGGFVCPACMPAI